MTHWASYCIIQEQETSNEESEPPQNRATTEPQPTPVQTQRPKRNREHFATIRTASVVKTLLFLFIIILHKTNKQKTLLLLFTRYGMFLFVGEEELPFVLLHDL